MKKHIPLSIPDLGGNEADYLERCIRENWVSSAGPFVTEIERRMAKVSGRKFGVAVVNGTAAIELCLRAMGFGKGERVALPDWTFAATANAVIHAGCEPVFVDVAPSSWTIDPAALLQVSERLGSTLKAVIAVDVLGHPAQFDELNEVSTKIGVPLIEDAAGAIGATYKCRPAGSFGKAATFSFNGNKTVTAGGGGMIVTDDEHLSRTARHLSTQARVGSEYVFDRVGYNYRMTNVNAAIGMAQLERLEEMVEARRRIADVYDAALAGRVDLMPMPRCEWAESSCWLYSVRCASEEASQDLLRHCQARGIESRTFWRSLSKQAPYKTFVKGDTPVSDSLSGNVVSLPCSSNLAEGDQRYVIEALNDWRVYPG